MISFPPSLKKLSSAPELRPCPKQGDTANLTEPAAPQTWVSTSTLPFPQKVRTEQTSCCANFMWVHVMQWDCMSLQKLGERSQGCHTDYYVFHRSLIFRWGKMVPFSFTLFLEGLPRGSSTEQTQETSVHYAIQNLQKACFSLCH